MKFIGLEEFLDEFFDPALKSLAGNLPILEEGFFIPTEKGKEMNKDHFYNNNMLYYIIEDHSIDPHLKSGQEVKEALIKEAEYGIKHFPGRIKALYSNKKKYMTFLEKESALEDMDLKELDIYIEEVDRYRKLYEEKIINHVTLDNHLKLTIMDKKYNKIKKAFNSKEDCLKMIKEEFTKDSIVKKKEVIPYSEYETNY